MKLKLNITKAKGIFFCLFLSIVACSEQNNQSIVKSNSDSDSGKSISILVQVPENTPDNATLSLGGDFNGWNPSTPGYQLTKTDKGYSYQFSNVTLGKALNFKITRGSWQTVEINSDGSNRENRLIEVTDNQQTHQLTVADWADLTTKQAPSTIVGEVIFKEIELPTYAGKRQLSIYLPPNYHTNNQHYPVIYMMDGQNLYDTKTANAGEWQIDEIMEELAKKGSPLTSIVVGIDHAGGNRGAEYHPFSFSENLPEMMGDRKAYIGKGDQFSDWLAFTLKPQIDKEFRTKPEREHTAVMGSSSGGLISCYVAMRHQAVFEKAGCYSPAFVKSWVGERWLEYIQSVGRQFPMKIHLDMGDNELGLYGKQILDEMIEVHQTFKKLGFTDNEVRYQVIKGGTHDEPSWRARTPEILQWLNKEN